MNCILVFFACILFSCDTCVNKSDELLILISKTGSDKSYVNWLTEVDSNIICVGMYSLNDDEQLCYLSQADAILLTGGEDISPDKYGKGGDKDRCGTIDLRRDSIEINLIRFALENEIPILGVE